MRALKVMVTMLVNDIQLDIITTFWNAGGLIIHSTSNSYFYSFVVDTTLGNIERTGASNCGKIE